MNSIGFRKPRRTVVFGFDDRIARQSIPALTSLSRHTRRELEVVILARRWRPWTKAYYRRRHNGSALPPHSPVNPIQRVAPGDL
jgi:hypothetical protein